MSFVTIFSTIKLVPLPDMDRWSGLPKASYTNSTMADKSATQRLRSEGMASKILKNPNLLFPFALISADAILVALIIAYVPCKNYLSHSILFTPIYGFVVTSFSFFFFFFSDTKIDWDAYMSQVMISLNPVLFLLIELNIENRKKKLQKQKKIEKFKVINRVYFSKLNNWIDFFN